MILMHFLEKFNERFFLKSKATLLEDLQRCYLENEEKLELTSLALP